MKKIVIILAGIFFIVTAVSISSYDYQSEEILSCDPVIDKKVKAQKVALLKKSRTEIGKESTEFQRAFWRSLTPERKFEIWEEKFSKVYELSWSEDKLSHIKEFSSKLSPELFAKSDSELKEFYHFADKWIQESYDKFGWTRDNLYYLIVNPFEDGKSSKLFLTNYVASCECSSHSDFCGQSTTCVQFSGGCQHTRHGCGALLMYMCDGKCENL